MNHDNEPANRIDRCLDHLRRSGQKALITFLVGGDPNLAATLALARTLLDNGTDLLEIGVPFSDPCADGPVIMAANTRALAGGVRLELLFELVRSLRRTHQAPVLFLLYYNTVYQFGLAHFFRTCHDSGVDGVIIPDLPPEEQQEAGPFAEQAGIRLIRMVSPLSAGRLPGILGDARGFVYCVAALGVTGERSTLAADLRGYARRLAGQTDLPRALGFGLSTPGQLTELAPDWDALIVGSALVRRIAEGHAAGLDRQALCTGLGNYCQSLRLALDQAASAAILAEGGAADA